MQDQLPTPEAPKQGRKARSKNKTTVMLEKLMEDNAKEIVNVVIEQAKAGDLTAARMVLERLMPIPQSRKVSFTMPPIESLADIGEAFDGVWRAVSSGAMTIEEGFQLGNLLNQNSEMLRSHNLERRIEHLESNARNRV